MAFAEFVDAGTRNLTLDKTFTIGDMGSQALALRNLRGEDILNITAPISGFGTSPIGGSIDIVDVAGMAQLSYALKNDDMSTISLGQQIR